MCGAHISVPSKLNHHSPNSIHPPACHHGNCVCLHSTQHHSCCSERQPVIGREWTTCTQPLPLHAHPMRIANRTKHSQSQVVGGLRASSLDKLQLEMVKNRFLIAPLFVEKKLGVLRGGVSNKTSAHLSKSYSASKKKAGFGSPISFHPHDPHCRSLSTPQDAAQWYMFPLNQNVWVLFRQVLFRG